VSNAILDLFNAFTLNIDATFVPNTAAMLILLKI
jgi:hypothetical protein